MRIRPDKMMCFVGIAMILLFSGCRLNVDYSVDKNVLVYDGTVYRETDSYGRNVSTAWTIPETSKTHKVSVYYGSDNENRKNNTTAEQYDAQDLDMFLLYTAPGSEKILYCKSSYDFPDYREGASVEAIKFYNTNTEITFHEKGKVDLLAACLKNAADDDVVSSEIADDMNDYLIEIKYSDCGAWYTYGKLVKDIDGHLSIACYDVNTAEVYTLSEEVVDVLASSGITL